MAIAHDFNTRFPTTDGTSGTNSVDTTTGDRTFTHNPTGVPKGAVVTVIANVTNSVVTGVLYAGISMSLITEAQDATEAGSVWIYALAQVTVPTDDPATITLQGCTADEKWATCSTVTAATTQTQVVGFNFKDTTTAANPTLTVVTSATSLLYGGLAGGAASPASYVPTANYTRQFSNDPGTRSATSMRRTSPVAAGSIVYDFTFATSDDYCIAAVALAEYTPPPFIELHQSNKTPLYTTQRASVW